MDPSSCPSLYSGKFDMEQMKESLAHWIMMHQHPFSIVEKDELNLFCRRGMPEWRVMTRNTAKAHWINVYESKKKKLKGLLKNMNKISLTTDCGKSNNQKIEYMVIIGHWIDQNWQLQKRVLNFVHILPPPVEVLKLQMPFGVAWRIGESRVRSTLYLRLMLQQMIQPLKI
ncbi:Zinc finger BED domain-containing protein RICESLEEPER 2 [Sesamum alatum]|uniref:Zinc finger BED domain-containing protein RICESLEEPER 2 n=1 Tax=Sesamum alatum TaxID=300844 RepID=A0AAE2CGS8_9LAMI|nr:Zinc finger BED domain-containing protein RICESLEEPER 2 [Sesamum alatum]